MRRYKCLVCNNSNEINYGVPAEVSVCPNCNGAMVDTFRIDMYDNVIRARPQTKAYLIKLRNGHKEILRDVHSFTTNDGAYTFYNIHKEITDSVPMDRVGSVQLVPDEVIEQLDDERLTKAEGSE